MDEYIRKSDAIEQALAQIHLLDITVRERILNFDEKARAKTNADHIKSMTDEELANWYFDKFFPCVPYCSMLQDGCPEHDDCKICLLDWLKQKYNS